MATDIPNIDSLSFEANATGWNQMSKEEVTRFIEVWLDAGESLARSVEMATDMAGRTNGSQSAEFSLKAAKADIELGRWRRMMATLRTGASVIKPPSDDTVTKVDKLSAAVGELQTKQGVAQAKLKAVTAVLSVATQVFAVNAPPPP